jgi:hypothetical protein
MGRQREDEANMRKISVPILCFGLAAAVVLLGALAAILGRLDFLLASLGPALICALIGFALRNFGD